MLTKREFTQLFAALGQQNGYNLQGKMYINVEGALLTLGTFCEEKPIITSLGDGGITLNWSEEEQSSRCYEV